MTVTTFRMGAVSKIWQLAILPCPIAGNRLDCEKHQVHVEWLKNVYSRREIIQMLRKIAYFAFCWKSIESGTLSKFVKYN